ncbi:MAG: DUF5597 domain-containing protein, partial [Ktedonobacteraceae bacterium]|nr:DUF5597 domain-containing protein [Ktedonobacteraceae bacterium]
MHEHLPQIVRKNGKSHLVVDGQPFVILGLQWDCDSCCSLEEMNPLFPHAARMGANTAALPLYWREVEPEPGRYDFNLVDERIRQAQAHSLRLVLLWFATWKNACTFYAPDYIRTDPLRFPPAIDRAGKPTASLCPSSQTTWQHDCNALRALMEHLRDVDRTHRVIMVQIENEPGILRSARCHCEVCNQRFTTDQWEARMGVHAEEAFSAVSIAEYIDRLAAEAKAIYPLPLYVNVALPPAVGGIPERYFSGGAVPEMFDLVRKHLHHIDLVAPDIYSSGYRDFHRLCRTYSTENNPLYVAEHSSSPEGRAERNVFYAIGEYGAIGFDPWAIDESYPDLYAPPLVHPTSGVWAAHAYQLHDSYTALARAITPIVAAQGTERIFTCVQEPAEKRTGWAAQGCDVLVSYHQQEGAGRGLLIQQGPDEFLLIGVGFSVQFQRP